MIIVFDNAAHVGDFLSWIQYLDVPRKTELMSDVLYVLRLKGCSLLLGHV